MPERQQTPPPPMGLYDTSQKERVTAIELVAIMLSLVWLGLSAALFLYAEPSAALQGQTGGVLWFVLVMLAIFLPVGMIWVAAIAMRSSRVMRQESRRLQVAIDAIRHAYVTQNQNRNAANDPSLARKLDEIAAAQRKTETALAMFSTTRQASPPKPAPAQAQATPETDAQVALPLGTPAEDMHPPLDAADFIRALNFPETAEDRDGFAALRRALKDRQTGQLVRASQDVLTLMSQDGIYMDDLRPDLARPEIWRRFAAGERGRSVAMLGGIRDRATLALTAARMKNDSVFRDAVHHFLRLFDRTVAQFAESAGDADLTALSDTRTARAFMILGRVAGIFD